MMRSRVNEGTGALAFSVCALALLLPSCGEKAPTPTRGDTQPAGAARRADAHLTAIDGTTCPAGVHETHFSRFACQTCHPVGGDFGFGAPPYAFPRGTTTAGGTITIASGAAPTCTVACHYPMGAPAHPVSWDAPGPLACTSCHATSTLPEAHPTVSADAPRSDCERCHASGAHLDGAVALVPHGPGWMDEAAPAFHAYSANRGLAACQQCHAADLGGGVTGTSCARCHDRKDASGTVVVAWKNDCTMCHGGPDGTTGAPPNALWGFESDPVRVGAHTAHLAGSGIAPAYDCGVCHVKPADALAAGHIDAVGSTDVPVASVAFSGIAASGVTTAPAWNRAAATCTNTYCHGATLAGGSNTAPTWTQLDGMQAACGTCHGVPPPAPHPAVSGGMAACNPCHSATIDASGVLIAPSAGGKHLDGRLDASGHPAAWMDQTSAGFHGSAANLGLASCQTCHGQDLGGGSVGVGCADCHGSGGQLTCTSCHRSVPGSETTRSSHLAGAGTPSSDCRTCHDASQQADGHYRLPAPGGSFPQTSCLACHDGQGEVLSARTPPLLVGWSDAVAGDWHGARVGVGYGGTLRAPYARGQDPLPCTACHDQHSSENAFLLASTVNGMAIPAAAIDRAGVGGEVLCAACHEGERHAGCIPCHGLDPEPAGNPCFWCHGHEGILQWYPPEACDNCHIISQPPVEHVAPALAGPPAVSGVTATSATVQWSTNELATSYVEYGVSTAGSVSGNNTLVAGHVVTLSGLEPGTTYVWRVRSSDAFRNVAESPLDAFTTMGADEVPTPDVAQVWAGTNVPNTTVDARLLWYPVTAPSGTAVEYEVQLASDPGFTVLVNANLSPIDGTLATGNSGWTSGTATTDWTGRPAVGFDVTLTNLPQDDCFSTQPNLYYFRVRARDQTGKVSGWSTTGLLAAIASNQEC